MKARGAKGSKAKPSGKSSKNKNLNEAFVKKLNLCVKVFDYKDDTKDIQGKTDRLNAINELQD